MVAVSRILLLSWVLISFGFMTMGYASIEGDDAPISHPHSDSLPQQ